jgi:hypothetical protein
MAPLTNNQYQSIKTCDNARCAKCLVCSETNYEEQRLDKWKQHALPTLNRLYQTIFLLQLRSRLANMK